MARWTHDEDGAVAVLVALSLVMLVLVTAIVVDLGLSRVDRMGNQTRADLAVTAAARALDPFDPDGFRAACDEALDYFIASTPDASPVSGDPCSAFDGFICDSSTATTVEAFADPYWVYVTMPVPNTSTLLNDGEQSFNVEHDGIEPCNRVAVRVDRVRNYLFAGVIGATDGRPTADAVARHIADGDLNELATLIVLDQTGCNALTTNGQGGIIVQNTTDGGVVRPGLVTVDSDATASGGPFGCGMNRYVIDAADGNGLICAGVDPMRAAAIAAGSGDACDSLPNTLFTPASELKDADPGDRSAVPARIDPEPRAASRVTRQPVEHRYNCMVDYYAGSGPELPSPTDPESVEGCTEGRQHHITNLAHRFRGRDRGWFLTNGFNVLQDCRNWDTVAVTNARGSASGGVFTGPWYFECQQGSISVGTGQSFDWVGGGGLGPNVVVFSDDVTQSGSGTITLNSAAAAVNPRNVQPTDHLLDAVAFFQEGDLRTSGSGALRLYSTMAYFDQGTVASSNRDIAVSAPVGPAYDGAANCTAYTDGGTQLPPPSCFEDLVAWVNFAGEANLGGQGDLDIDGIFFLPNVGRSGSTQFDLNGGSSQFLAHAQFFAYRIRVTGDGLIRMEPDPNRIVELESLGSGLIR